MRTSTLVLGVCGLVLGACVAIACGANSNDGKFGSAGAGNNGQGGDGGNGEGGSGDNASGGSGGAIPFDAPLLDVPSSETTLEENCAAQSASGEVWPLDMYLMMDQSGSMQNPFGMSITKTKWQAVTEGLSTFFTNQPANADLGVGIQFFPLYKQPWSAFPTCKSDYTGCDSSHVCVGSPDGKSFYCMNACSGPSDCTGGDECYLIDSANNISICTNDICDASAYGTPEVPIDMLANSKQAVLGAMNAHKPINLTPTAAAMEGAVQYTAAHASQHLDRKVIIVLATDGQPTDCPVDGQPLAGTNKAKQLAQQAAAANPSVKTFVIGVIDTGDFQGLNSCNSIAAAGGTGAALILKQNQPLAQQFSDALDKIKGSAVGCDFKVPSNDAGKIDTTKVNVVYTVNGGAEQTVYAVNTVGDCDATDGGWYYDNPADPTSITLCPATCAQVQKSGQKVDVSIQMGCKTVFMPPK
ncbi:MAG: VWA domain-containing protein [Deltaproteobacteria bacterium]|nr:VWA domain-containing protein [Deltaproteobacteria bacterium]